MLRSIRSKVLVSQIALIVLVTVFMGVTGYFIMKGNLMDSQREKLEFIAQSKADDVEKRFADVKNLFRTITANDVLEVYHQTYSELAMIEHFLKFTDDFPTLSYASFYGTEQFRITDGELNEETRDISDTVMFQDATWSPGEILYSEVQPSPDGIPSMSLAVARETFFGKPMGVITTTVPLKRITAPIENFTVGATGFIMMIRRNGKIISHPDREMLFNGLNGGGDAREMVTQAQDLKSGFGRATMLGVDSLVAFVPVEGTGWTIISVLPYKEFIAGPNVLRNTIAIASAVILLAVSLLALFAVGGTTNALTKLTAAAKAIAGGDLNQRVYTSTGDEIEVLSNSFNTMAEQLEKTYRSLHNLSAHLLSVREEERKAVAREVHDELGQVLSTLKIDLSWLKKRLPEEREELTQKAISMLELIDSTIDIVQNITSELRPPVLDDLGLAAAIESEAEKFGERTGIKCEVSVEDFPLDLSVSATVFRVFQESMLNVARHADASRVGISLKVSDGSLEMAIKDNGRGITEEDIGAPTSFGLMGMRERILAIGGKVELKGSHNMGTLVTVNVPLKGTGEATI
jgi:signal transduction histidine kinase